MTTLSKVIIQKWIKRLGPIVIGAGVGYAYFLTMIVISVL